MTSGDLGIFWAPNWLEFQALDTFKGLEQDGATNRRSRWDTLTQTMGIFSQTYGELAQNLWVQKDKGRQNLESYGIAKIMVKQTIRNPKASRHADYTNPFPMLSLVFETIETVYRKYTYVFAGCAKIPQNYFSSNHYSLTKANMIPTHLRFPFRLSIDHFKKKSLIL